MSYHANPQIFTATFAIPTVLTDRYLRLADEVQLKVLLLALRSNPLFIVPEQIADFLSLNESDVKDALGFWTECGVLVNDGELPVPENAPPIDGGKLTSEKPRKKVVRSEIVKPTREEIARRGDESPEITFMLREAQMTLGRPLKQSEMSTFVWLYDDEGMSVPLILQLIAFAVSEERANIGFIERTAIDWINDGVKQLSDAERKISEYHARKSSWYAVERAMGLEHRMPSKKEEELAYKWMYDYGFETTVIRRAYELCVDTTSKFSMPYIKKILEEWHKKGVHKVADIDNLNDEKSKKDGKKSDNMATYDMELYRSRLEQLPE